MIPTARVMGDRSAAKMKLNELKKLLRLNSLLHKAAEKMDIPFGEASDRFCNSFAPDPELEAALIEAEREQGGSD